MSPTPTTSRRPQSSPTQSSWTRRRSSPTKVFPRTPTTMTLHSRICFTKHTEHMPITLYEKTCLSVCRRRQCPIERGDPLEIERGDPLSKETRKHRLGFCSTNKSKFLPSARQKLTNTNFKPLTTEEVYENCVKLLILNKKNFTALELKKFNNEINSFSRTIIAAKFGIT